VRNMCPLTVHMCPLSVHICPLTVRMCPLTVRMCRLTVRTLLTRRTHNTFATACTTTCTKYMQYTNCAAKNYPCAVTHASYLGLKDLLHLLASSQSASQFCASFSLSFLFFLFTSPQCNTRCNTLHWLPYDTTKGLGKDSDRAKLTGAGGTAHARGGGDLLGTALRKHHKKRGFRLRGA
jgi:hypothetical protein